MEMQALSARAVTDSLWSEARERLIRNVEFQNYVPGDDSPAYYRDGSKKVILPAYVPYIGPDYFRFRPRLICYAVNQNISRHRKWSADWVTQWGADRELALDRLNRAAAEGKAIPIRPYAEGFIPLAAAIVLEDACRRSGKELPEWVDYVIAATNFVKFSTWEDASSASIPGSWWRECAVRYVTEEILTLQPDIIVSLGGRTAVELEKLLGRLYLSEGRPKHLPFRFPGHIASIRARSLLRRERNIWQKQILPLAERLLKPPPGSYQTWRMLDFPVYFIDIYQSLKNG